MKIICFAKSRGEAASTRQRALGLLDVAKQAGWETEYHWVPAYPRWKFTPMRLVRLWRYAAALHRADNRTVIVLQRTLRCPEFLWYMKRMRPRLRCVISDFDDAVWVHSPKGFHTLLELSDEIWCGSRLIVERVHALGFTPTFVPTLIRTSIYDGVRRPEPVPVIGWVGDGYAHRHNLADFARTLGSCLSRLPPFRLRLIGVGSHRESIASMFSFLGNRIDLIDWVDPLDIPRMISTFSVGIMPLLPDEFNAGKSGLKILEYMAAGIPVVASDVGENVYIVDPPMYGLLARTPKDWENHLTVVLGNPSMGIAMGDRGRIFVRASYDRETVYGQHFKRLEERLST